MHFIEELSIKPINTHLYQLAFIHDSYSHEHGLSECYNRLEFLGDAVLDLVVSEFLYQMDSHLTEGELTRMRANYVCKKALYTYSTGLGLEPYIKLGAGLELTSRELDSVIADVFESLIGALYLDLGLEAVKEFLAKTVLPHIKNKEVFHYDYKSELKELCDAKVLDLSYDLISEEGEPHKKIFTIDAIINGKRCGTGSGGSKKEAEQNAAKIALRKI
ncbi:MAG: ribonuclease III [Methanobacterium sp.]